MKDLFRISLFGWVITCLLLVVSPAYAGGTETLQVKTSAVCGECKGRIETAAFSVSGVKTASLDMKTKVLTVKFNPEKTNHKAIIMAITKAGYDADEVKADTEAFKQLPQCCQMNLGH